VRAIADTGFLVAFWNHRDQHHGWAKDVARDLADPFLTCDAVLAETAFHIGSSAVVLDFVRSRLIQPVFSVAENLDQLAGIAKRYPDCKPDFADVCLIRLSELYPIQRLRRT
jgi:uncharacterized protein